MASKYIDGDLMAEIVRKAGSIKGLSEKVGIPYDVLYGKFSGKTEWKVFEAIKVAKALDMNLIEFTELIGG